MRSALAGRVGSILSVLGCTVVLGCADGPEFGGVGKGMGPDAAIEAVDEPSGTGTSEPRDAVALGSLEPYRNEGEPLLGWVREARFNVRAGRVAILDYVHPNVKVFDDRLRLEFVAAVGDRRSPNEHGISDLFLTDGGTVVVVTESGWVIGLREGKVMDLGIVGQGASGPGRLRLAACATGWAVVSETSGAVRPIPLDTSPDPRSLTEGSARRPPTVSVATDPAELAELAPSRTDPIPVGAASTGDEDCRTSRPSRLRMEDRSIPVPADADPGELVVFPDPSGGGVVTLGGPGPWFATGLLEPPGAGS